MKTKLSPFNSFVSLCYVVLTFFICSCGGSGGSSSSPSYTISGNVSVGGNGLSGVLVTLDGGNSIVTATTGSDGNYTFSEVKNGSYTLEPALRGYEFNPSSIAVTVNNASISGQNFVASALPTSIVTDTTWKASETLPNNWESTSFDDSTWANAFLLESSPWGPASDHIIGTTAQYIWYYSTPMAIGSQRQSAVFRKAFIVAQLPTEAMLSIFANYDFDLWVNDTLLASQYGCTWWIHTPTSLQYPLYDSVNKYLVEGKNVIAIRVISCEGPVTLLAEVKMNY